VRTAKLGSASSMLGNIVLGYPPAAGTVQTFTASIAPAGVLARQLATSQPFVASMSFSGSLVTVLRGEPAVISIALAKRSLITITLEAG